MDTTTPQPAEASRRIPQDKDRCWRRRIAAGLSQMQLAELSGLSDATVCRIENGTVAASVESLAALAAAFGCEIADLMPAETEVVAS